MNRRYAPFVFGLLGIGSLALLASCDAPGGDGTRWGCATGYNGTAQGTLDGSDTSGRIAARLYLPPSDTDFCVADEWCFEGVYEELEGPLEGDNKAQGFGASVDESGALTPADQGMSFSGEIDLEGACDVSGTWEFFGDSSGDWEARP